MANITFADSTGRYDGRHLDTHPLGATETSVIYLAHELAKRGHNVTVFTHCEAAIEHEGVHWRPLGSTPPEGCDLFVAVQHTELLGLVRSARRQAIWILWQPNHLENFHRIWRMWRHRPVPVFASQYQVRTYTPLLRRRAPDVADDMRNPEPPLSFDFRTHPIRSLRYAVRIGRLRRALRLGVAWAALPHPHPWLVIPLGLPDEIRGLPPLTDPPAPHAIFASNPVRNLRRLVEIWATSILPRVPNAILDVYGIHDLGARDAWQAWEGSLLPPGLPPHAKASVRIHQTAPRHVLMEAMRASRLMLYLGHECEAFCVSLAEAQALGVPAVVAPVGALPERVIDGVTGFQRADPQSFAAAAVSLLTDNALWRRQHEACLSERKGLTWSEYADRFETALLGISRSREGGGQPERLEPQ
jgi:glycosyltransferase involved in cell wall biosynthesis